MAICEICGLEIEPMDSVVATKLEVDHFFCTEQHKQLWENPPAAAETPPKDQEEQEPVVKEAASAPKPKRKPGRPRKAPAK